MVEKAEGYPNSKSDPIKTFVGIIERKAPKDGSMRYMSIEICSPVKAGDVPGRLKVLQDDWSSEEEGLDLDSTNVIAHMEVHPTRGRYEVVYRPKDAAQPGWILTLNREGHVLRADGISEEGFKAGMAMLIDPEFPEPAFRVGEIDVSQDEGDFELPEGHGFMGTLTNRNIYVGGITMHYLDGPSSE